MVRRFLALFLLACWFAVGYEGFRNMYVTEEFEEHKGDRLVLFWADWCPHCNAIKSKDSQDSPKEWDLLERKGGVSTSKGNVPAVNYEVDEAPAIVEKYKIKSFPTVLFIKSDGTVIQQTEGSRNVKGWEEFAKENI
tara:strand:+ start:346 stop:756 length:411 start_codon:yes stop_codon:yes gene_type:complete